MKNPNGYFLSCLYGSQQEADNIQAFERFSKLPIRQSTMSRKPGIAHDFSKLPIRQSTLRTGSCHHPGFSKLPIRQSTLSCPFLS